MGAREIVEIGLFATYAALLVWTGFRRREGFASWHMFAGVSRSHWNVVDADSGAPFNPWDYLPHSQLIMNDVQLQLFLMFLRQVHGLKLNGLVELRDGFSVRQVAVWDTHVVG
jgi:hypothetical protein